MAQGLRLDGVRVLLVEDDEDTREVLTLGLELTAVADAHLCCGSAGTYSILQTALAEELRANKLRALEANQPDVIATANIGCLLHLAAGTQRPVRHWIELLDHRLRDGG